MSMPVSKNYFGFCLITSLIITGEAVSGYKWASSDFQGPGLCGSYSATSGKWSHERCDVTSFYICELCKHAVLVLAPAQLLHNYNIPRSSAHTRCIIYIIFICNCAVAALRSLEGRGQKL